MEEHGYKDLAKAYDLVNQKKDYAGEVFFLKSLFEKNNVKKVLDVGCGTGTHMKLLEDEGFECDGVDINQDMLDVAKFKVRGNLTLADMTNFDLGKKYDAVICMFAVFNHLINLEDAKKALICLKKHLNFGGILLIDLHNPQGSGSKQDSFDNVIRKMKWNYDYEKKIEESEVVFLVEGKEIKDKHFMRIYTIEDISDLVEAFGFSDVAIYEGYGFSFADSSSKNLEVFARLCE